MDMNEATAKAIGAERGIAGMTVRELASAAGIPERSLMRVLQAERDIKVNQVAQIATALGIYPHELIESAEVILARAERSRPALIAAPTDPEDYVVDEGVTPDAPGPSASRERSRGPRPTARS